MKNKGILITFGLIVVGLSVALIVKAGGKKKGDVSPTPTPPSPIKDDTKVQEPIKEDKVLTPTTKDEVSPLLAKIREKVELLDFRSGLPISQAPKVETFEDRKAKMTIITKDLPKIQLPSIPKKIVVPMSGAKLRNSMTTLSKSLKTYGADAPAIAVLEELENALGVKWFKARDGQTIGFIRTNQVKPYSS